MDIYSHCYYQLKSMECTNCNFIAKFDETNEYVQINVSICGPNSLSAFAYIDGKRIWDKAEIEVDCQPADCPFSEPQKPHCVPSSPLAIQNC